MFKQNNFTAAQTSEKISRRVTLAVDGVSAKKKKLLSKCFALTAVIIFLTPATSMADGCIELVYYDCKPYDSLYVKSMCLYDITPVLNEHIILLDKIGDTETRECQITPTHKTIVHIGRSSTPRNDDMDVWVDHTLIGTSSFDNPDDSYAYVISNVRNKVRTSFTHTVGSGKIVNSEIN